ncbi:MAG: hypothetical protein MJ002_05645 [Paludibacteraceae bacterium]|nr:hypothetical protein [Paludibacteraceae bacterium]
MSNHTKHYTLNENQRELVRLSMPFARSLANHYLRPGIKLDDLYQQAYLGLCDAADNYRPDAGASFTTFAELHVIESIEVFIQHYGPGKILSRMPKDAYVEQIPIDNPDGADDDKTSLTETLPDASQRDLLEEAEAIRHNNALYNVLISILSPEERQLVLAYLNPSDDPISNLPVWRRFNISKSAFYTRLRVAFLKMKALAHQLGTQPNH